MTDPKNPQSPAKPCEHPSFSKERILGADTGDYKCDKCGAEFSRSAKERIEASRSQSK